MEPRNNQRTNGRGTQPFLKIIAGNLSTSHPGTYQVNMDEDDPSSYLGSEQIASQARISIPQVTSPDGLVTTSLRQFIVGIGTTSTMFIFDSILAAKRILFLGDPKVNSVEEVQDYMMSAISLVSPPLHGVLNLVHPYVHL